MNGKRFVVVSDTHGDMVDEAAASAFFAFLADWNPQIRVQVGRIIRTETHYRLILRT